MKRSIPLRALGAVLASLLSSVSCGPTSETSGEQDDNEFKATESTQLDPAGASGEGEVQAGASIRYAFPVQAGRVYRFSCEPLTVSGCLVDLRTADGQPVGEYTRLPETTRRMQVYFDATGDGQLIADVRAEVFNEAGRFRYELVDLGPDDKGDTAETASLSPGPLTLARGQLEHPSDVDTWRFSVPAGHFFAARVYPSPDAPEAAQSLRVSYQLLRPDGSLLVDPNASQHSSPWYENTTGEDVVLRISNQGLTRTTGLLSVGGGRYGLDVMMGPDDHPDAAPEGTLVAVPGSVGGTWEKGGDVDVVAVDLSADARYGVACPAMPSPWYCAVDVKDAQGTSLGRLQVSTAAVSLTVPQTGRYFLEVGRARGDGLWKWAPPGGFRLELSLQAP